MTHSDAIFKRAFDFVLALVGMIVFFPCAILIAVLIKCTSAGPVFFMQERIGRFGNQFKCIKFRTMTTGADHQGTITTAKDSRITSLGRLLRAFKLDEFPQLWNVIIGKMSFVGPRPDVAGYADNLSGEDRKILQLRPGITGPASIFFRYEEQLLARVPDPKDFNDHRIWPVKVAINHRYVEKYSFFRDIGYIMITLLPFLNSLMVHQPASPTTPEAFEKLIKEWQI